MPDDVLAQLTKMIEDVVGADVLLGVEITKETTFSDDIGLESIEFVALADRLRQHYGERVDLVGFLAEMDIDEIMAMSVGRLVDHIEASVGLAADRG